MSHASKKNIPGCTDFIYFNSRVIHSQSKGIDKFITICLNSEELFSLGYCKILSHKIINIHENVKRHWILKAPCWSKMIFQRARTYFTKLSSGFRGVSISATIKQPLIASWRQKLMSESNGCRKIVGYWLLGSSGLVFGLVVLGGLTRLTESGLSMVDWKLIHFRAPKNEEEWQAYFEKYKQFPEYQLYTYYRLHLHIWI